MKQFSKWTPFLFVALLAGGFFACTPEEEIPEQKTPDTLQTEYGEIIISEDYVPIDWSEGKNEILSIEVPSETQAVVTMEMEDKNTAAQIQKGSILTLDLDTAMYLRKVVSATIDGTTVKAVTEQATLEDVFSGSDFELCMGEEPDVQLYEFPEDEDMVFPDSLYPEEEEEEEFYPYNADAGDDDDEDDDEASFAPWHRNDRSAGAATPRVNAKPYQRSTRRLPQFHPTELRYYDENGNWVHESYDNYVARQMRTRGDGDPHSVHFDLGGSDCIDLHSPDDGSGFSMGIKGGATFSCDLGFKMSTNYGEEGFVSSYKKGHTVITPVFFFEPYLYLNLQAYIKGEKKLSKETTSKIKPKLIASVPGPGAVFMLGPVPVFIKPNGNFYAEPEFTFTAEADFTFGGILKTESACELGLKWDQYAGKFSRVSSAPKWVWESQEPTFALSGSVEATIYIYPEFNVQLYNILGPYAALKPYVRSTLSAGVNTTTGPAWQWDAAFGTKFETGIKAEVVGYELAKKEFKSTKLGKEISIFAMPFGLNVDGPSKVEVGQLYEINATVLNKIYTERFTNKWIPVSVHFETADSKDYELYKKGDSSGGTAHYAISVLTDDDGVAGVQWCPMDASSSLTVSIYSPDGKMIDFATYRIDNTPDGVEAIDMGTGILWADRNIGADEINDPGDYAGWGDVSGKHQEQCFDAAYGNYVEDPEKVLKYYGGKSPHSNISGTKYDMATTTWGGKWRMPTKKEWDKLIKYCNVKYSSGRDGYVVTRDGKELFFPAGGYSIGDWFSLAPSDGSDGETSGEYWSATLDSKDNTNAYYCGFTGTGATKKSKGATGVVPRYYNQSFRAVRDK